MVEISYSSTTYALSVTNTQMVIPYFSNKAPAVVSYSADGARLGGAGLVSGTTGKLGRAWVVHASICHGHPLLATLLERTRVLVSCLL